MLCPDCSTSIIDHNVLIIGKQCTYEYSLLRLQLQIDTSHIVRKGHGMRRAVATIIYKTCLSDAQNCHPVSYI